MNARLLKFLQVSLLSVATLLAGCQRKEAPTPPSATPGASSGGIVSAEKNSFDEVTSKLDKGGNLYVYMSTEKVLAGLSDALTHLSNSASSMPIPAPGAADSIARGFGFADSFIRDSGVEEISGLGASSIAREPGFYYSKIVVHHYAGKNDGLIWTVFGKEHHPLKELDMLPESTAFASYSDLDVPLAWKTVQTELTRLQIPGADKQLGALHDQFQTRTGLNLDDVLGSFNGGFGVIFCLDETKLVSLPIPGNPIEIPEPGLAIFAKVKNDVIFNRVDKLLEGNPLVVKTDRPGMKSRTFNSPIPLLPIDLSPTIAQSGDYLIVSSSSDLVREILDVRDGKRPGFKSTPEFKHLSQGIPLDGNNFSLLSEKLGRTLGKGVQSVMNSQAAFLGSQATALKSMMDTNQTNSMLSVGVNGDDGWEAFANGNRSINAMLLPAVAGVGAMAAIAIPNFVKARTTAQATGLDPRGLSRTGGCINNLRLIDSAKQQWALEHNKSSSDTPTAADIAPYIGRGPQGEIPKCPDGGVYTIGAVGVKPTCSVPGHVLP